MLWLALALSVGSVAIAGVVWFRMRRSRSRAGLPQLPFAPMLRAPTVAAAPQAAVRRTERARATLAPGLRLDDGRCCPSCLREYFGARYCTSDGRRLAPARELRERGRGGRCVACQRAYDPGLATCPHDGATVVPFSMALHEGVGRRTPTQPAHVVARICPVCGLRDDLHARFCSRDGAALLVIN